VLFDELGLVVVRLEPNIPPIVRGLEEDARDVVVCFVRAWDSVWGCRDDAQDAAAAGNETTFIVETSAGVKDPDARV
jgi:hypothetical protein